MQSGQEKSTGSSAGSSTESSAGSRGTGRDADQQGRWSLPSAKVFASGWGVAVGGLLMRHQVPSIQHSMQHSVL